MHRDRRRLDRLARSDADQTRQLGGRHVALVARLDGQHPRARLLRFGRGDTSFGGTRPALNRCRTSATLRLRSRDALLEHVHRCPRGDDRPERARDLETQDRPARPAASAAIGRGFGPRRPLERIGPPAV